MEMQTVEMQTVEGDVQESSPADQDTRPGDGYVQSFARGLAVIRAFDSAHPSMTLSEVAEAAGITRAGARRILLTLVQLGYVAVDGRQFHLTARILELGFAYLSSMPFWNLAEPIMEALVSEVHESCSASVLDGPDIVYVLRIPTSKIMTISLGIGSRLPAFCTSMGRVLLSDLDDAASTPSCASPTCARAPAAPSPTKPNCCRRSARCATRAGPWSTRSWKKAWCRSARRSAIATSASSPP